MKAPCPPILAFRKGSCLWSNLAIKSSCCLTAMLAALS
jgi:hypothetical protein